jgi:hypothetical protein
MNDKDPYILINKLERELTRWRLAVLELTPGGSEFVNDPDLCRDYIYHQGQFWKNAALRFKAQRDELQTEQDAGR